MDNLLFGQIGKLEWWWYVLIMLVLTHITIASVTLYLHRSKTHGSVEFHSFIQHFFRLWLWLTTGMKTHEWVAVHRSHHAKCETVEDPHSPQHYGIETLLFRGVKLYKNAVINPNTAKYVRGKLAVGLPDDWVEHNVYSKHPLLGLIILGILQIMILGLPGVIIFIIQAYWIPILAAGVINGIGHYWGYRNAETLDASHNIFPWGVLIGGEELHNNHHAYQTSPKLSLKWWEFDIGWVYICVLRVLGLAKVDERKVVSLPVSVLDIDPLGRDDFLELFKKHSAYVGAKFKKVSDKYYDEEDCIKLIDSFNIWLRQPNEVSSFELEQWIGQAEQLNDDFHSFVNWFRNLREIDL